MKNMRSVATLAAMGLVLAGCGSSDEDKDSASEPGGDYSGQTLVVTTFGGSFDEALISAVVEPFEEKFDVTVELQTVLSAEALTTLQAQGANSGFDVVQFSGGQEYAAAELDLIAPLNDDIVTNAADVEDAAVVVDDYAPYYAFNATGLLYNSDEIPEAPESWDVLGDPTYEGRVGLPDMSVTAGLNLVVSLAKAGGGDEEDIDPGFEKLEEYLPNSYSVYSDGATMSQLFSKGDIVLGVFDSGYAFTLAKSGLPVRFTVPEEGGVLYGLNSQVVAGSDEEALAQEWVNFQLDPEVQAAFAEASGYAPTNSTAELSPEVAELIPLTSLLDRLEKKDDEAVALAKADWTDRWNRLVSQ